MKDKTVIYDQLITSFNNLSEERNGLVDVLDSTNIEVSRCHQE